MKYEILVLVELLNFILHLFIHSRSQTPLRISTRAPLLCQNLPESDKGNSSVTALLRESTSQPLTIQLMMLSNKM